MPGNGEQPPGRFDEARKRAREAANDAVGDRLDSIVAGADELQQVFEDLKLTDAAAFEQLTRIVRDAADRNESVGQVIDRLKAIGQVGTRLAEKVAGLTPADVLRVLVGGEGEG